MQIDSFEIEYKIINNDQNMKYVGIFFGLKSCHSNIGCY